MIRAVFLENGYYIAGHAGYAPSGSDIVCAAVSALAQSAYLALKHYGVASGCYQNDKAGIFAVVIIESEPAKRALAETAVTQMRLGIEEIAKQFPQYLRFIPHHGGGNNDV